MTATRPSISTTSATDELTPRTNLGRSTPKEFRTGVLFVHGIGAQQRGQTLSLYANAMFEWIRDRIGGITEGHRHRGTPRERVTEAWKPLLDAPASVQERYATPMERHDAVLGHAAQCAQELASGPKEDDHETEQRKRLKAALIDREIARHLAFLETEQLLQRSADPERKSEVPSPPHEPLVAMAELSPYTADRGGDGPQAAAVEISWVEEDRAEHTTRWLWAESWWAEEFKSPKLTSMLRWLPASLWLTAVTQGWPNRCEFRSGWRQWLGEARIVLGLVFWFSFALLGTPLVWAVVGLTGVASMLPSKRLRGIALQIRALTLGVVGDAYALAELPLASAAMQHKVRRDLYWLAQRCDKVVVVGHSQGALLAYLACRQGRPANVGTLVTLGSGIRKLHRLMTFGADNSVTKCFALGGVVSASLLGAAVWGVIALSTFGESHLGALALTTAIFAVGAGLLVEGVSFVKATSQSPDESFWRSLFDRMDGFPFLQSPGSFRWFDLYASHDPIPAGDSWSITVAPKGADPISDSRYPRSYEVTNDRSVLRDHTSYLSNREECVAALVGYAAALDGTNSHRWLAPTPTWRRTSVAPARSRIVQRANRLSRTVWILLFIVLALRLTPAFPEALRKFLTEEVGLTAVMTSMGLYATDIGLALVFISAFATVASAKAFALQRLQAALLQRRYEARNETEDATEPARYFIHEYGRASLGEWLGLAATSVVPLATFVIAFRYSGPWAAAVWTLFSIGITWLPVSVLRGRQIGVWDVTQWRAHRQEAGTPPPAAKLATQPK